MEQNEPEKKIPSTAAKAITLVPNVESLSLIHLRAQSAFFLILGILLMALNNLSFFIKSLTYVSINKEYVSKCIFCHINIFIISYYKIHWYI